MTRLSWAFTAHPDLQDLPCTNAGGPGLIDDFRHRIVLDLVKRLLTLVQF